MFVALGHRFKAIGQRSHAVYHAPEPCSIPNASRYWTDAGPEALHTYVAYFTADDGGTLRFSDMDCTPYDFTLATSSLPSTFSATGLVIRAGSEA